MPRLSPPRIKRIEKLKEKVIELYDEGLTIMEVTEKINKTSPIKRQKSWIGEVIWQHVNNKKENA